MELTHLLTEAELKASIVQPPPSPSIQQRVQEIMDPAQRQLVESLLPYLPPDANVHGIRFYDPNTSDYGLAHGDPFSY